jgi:hypothetical protein
MNAATGSDTVWVFNAGTGSTPFTVTGADAPWMGFGSTTGQLPVSAGGPAAAGPAGAGAFTAGSPAPLNPPAGEEVMPPQPALAGSVPVVVTATRGTRTRGDYTGYVLVRQQDDWAGPSTLEVRLRVHEREVQFLTPAKMSSRPVALAVAPEGDLGVMLVNGQIVRMNPQTGATTPWASTTANTAWWGMAFGPDSAAYVGEFDGVLRIARDGTLSRSAYIGATVYDVVVTPAGAVFAAAANGLYRYVASTRTLTRITTEHTYGVAYNPADGMIYASVNGPQIRRVNPSTGAITSIAVADGTIQQQLEIGGGGVMYGRSYYLDDPDMRRLSPTGQTDRVWWTPQPFPQAITLAPDGTLYGAAGDRVFRIKVEGELPPTHVAGDVTGDGAVTAQDALGVLSAAVGKTLPEGWIALDGDANCDGQATAQDALIILSHAVGKDVAQFCVGTPRP